MQKYKPQTAKEAALFMDKFCNRCIHDRAYREGKSITGCKVLARSMLCDVNSRNYPSQLCIIKGVPTCTQFKDFTDKEGSND
ncbi:MAG: hypothetical protein Kow00102_03180 [Spirochaetota bacterium]|nr:hypothetical protein [Spirochaetota bacterium]